MSLKWVLFFALLGLAAALPKPERSYGSYSDEHSYEFSYHVDEKDSSEEYLKFGHGEKKSGEKVEGEYYVLLPNGLLQKVEYYVEGDSGFVAKVSYEGSEEEYSEEKSRRYY